jgi:hypothetical protein
MKHIKLYEDFDFDKEFKSEDDRHRKALADLNQKMIKVVDTCMFVLTEDYGFEVFYSPSYTDIGYSLDEDIILSQDLVSELLSANKKLIKELNRQILITGHNSGDRYDFQEVALTDIEWKPYLNKKYSIELKIDKFK